MNVLAQDLGYSEAIFWSIAVLGLCVGLFFVAGFVRKRVRGDSDDAPATGFTLADLRELHRTGKMSAEEFDKAKAKLLDATKAAAMKPKPPAADFPSGRHIPPQS